MSLGIIQRHLLFRVSRGALTALALVYLVGFLLGLVEKLESLEEVSALFAEAHFISMEVTSSVLSLCVSIGAGLALAHVAWERGGVAMAIGGATSTSALLPTALLLSIGVGLWVGFDSRAAPEQAISSWGDTSWGYVQRHADASMEWMWVDQEGALTVLSASSMPGAVTPPAEALAALATISTGLPIWLRESVLLLLVLLTFGARMDRSPEGLLFEAVPLSLFGFWFPVAFTPLVHALLDVGALGVDLIALFFTAAGLYAASRLQLNSRLR